MYMDHLAFSFSGDFRPLNNTRLQYIIFTLKLQVRRLSHYTTPFMTLTPPIKAI